MFRHLLKLTWKRKSRNLMLSLEILLAFVVVFAVAAYAVRSSQLYQMPIGFTPDNVWAVEINMGEDDINKIPELYDTFIRGLEEMPEVERAAFATHAPFTRSSSRIHVKDPATNAVLLTYTMNVTDNFADVAGLRLVEGRWFSDIDNGSAAVPAVINRRFAQRTFGDQSPLGRQFTSPPGDLVMKVVGVIEDYRSEGELGTPDNFALLRFVPTAKTWPLRTILVRLKPGTSRAFETTLQRKLTQLRNNWAYKATPLKELRSTIMKESITPLVILAVIGAFMLAMVAFGLFGVLWQSTTQRIPEIGIRRALGASSAAIYRQIIAEQMLLSTGAILIALVLLVQLPLTGAMSTALNWTVFAVASAISMAVIYLISLLCALYPGWRASRLSPTEALHYE